MLSSAVTVQLAPGANALVDELLVPNTGIDILSASVTGHQGCSALFTMGQMAVPKAWFPDEGIVLSSGGPESLDMQDGPDETTCHETGGDPDLDTQISQTTEDACVLEIEFTSNDFYVTFEYVFGSDEYLEWVASAFNDAFGKCIVSTPGFFIWTLAQLLKYNSCFQLLIQRAILERKQSCDYPRDWWYPCRHQQHQPPITRQSL